MKPCPRCATPTSLTSVAVAHTHGTVRGEVERFPILRCAAGHDLPALDAAEDTIVAAAGDALVTAARPQLPWRAQRCGRCGTELTMPGRRAVRAVTVVAPDCPVFTVRLDLPLLRCIDDAVENLPREAWQDLVATVGGLVAAAHTPPALDPDG